MAYTEASKNAVNKYNAKMYEQIPLRVKKGEKEQVKEQAKKRGMSVNEYIIGLIKSDMEQG